MKRVDKGGVLSEFSHLAGVGHETQHLKWLRSSQSTSQSRFRGDSMESKKRSPWHVTAKGGKKQQRDAIIANHPTHKSKAHHHAQTKAHAWGGRQGLALLVVGVVKPQV